MGHHQRYVSHKQTAGLLDEKKNTYLKGKSYYQTRILYNIFKDPYKESKSEVCNSPNIINSREITTDYTNIRPNIILDGFFPLII